MVSLDRFAYGLPDPQEKEPSFVGTCKHCGTLICEGEFHVVLDDDVYCDSFCLAQSMGALFVY